MIVINRREEEIETYRLECKRKKKQLYTVSYCYAQLGETSIILTITVINSEEGERELGRSEETNGIYWKKAKE